MVRGWAAAALALQPLLQVHFRVPLLLVRARELAAAHVARERLLARVRAHVRREVVRPAEGAHADPALERLLTRVDANVPRQLVRPREPPVAAVHGAGVRALVHGRLAWPVRILAGFDRHQAERLRALLVHLRENLVALARGGVVLCELHGGARFRGRARCRGAGVGLALGQTGGARGGLRRAGILLLPGVLLLLRRRAVLAVLRRRAVLLRRAVALALGREQVYALLVLLLEVLVDRAGAGAGRQQPLQRRRGRVFAAADARPVERCTRARRVAGVLGACPGG